MSRPVHRIAVVPAYNEEATVEAVLDVLAPLVDELVVVDDGSIDHTRKVIQEWLPGHDHVRLLWHDENQGMSEAYYLALTDLRTRLQAGELDADDLVLTIDADGQHDLAVLDALIAAMSTGRLDANLARRDLSGYPAIKKIGNWVMSTWASLWAGQRLHDVESGYRVFRLGALAHALDYYTGYQYSETVEVAVVLCRLGYRVRNDQLVPVPVFRSRTSMRDAAIDLAVMPRAAWRVWRAGRQQAKRSTGQPERVSA
jgi:glycosyltransferase involved in cell wall biosynthesis